MRFVGADGKDVLPRKDRVWATGGVLGRMRDALKAAERDVPGWLDVVALETSSGEVETALFAMF